ncbi:PREDICTED: putative HERV-K_Xq28 provirus ancestral Pol protein [Tinamus guttatus]|uniref:putative HERV-K_Xq28 provirus ancestral Pol protein n=1 Tax=Tinamus guttatus TaxID=94827 RepID=UPI00052E7AD7|nr:PREDICTED: putative HERV-K_Xq28 provirus ancestral Pol protein [Tinamus guttatus]
MPIFAIRKKDKTQWRLLHDLRKVNNQMEIMGALQPRLPVLSLIPEGWAIVVIDIKDCFFSIPLSDEDSKRFAFTLPAINKGQPATRWQWVVLPQGMANSPTLCQMYMAEALNPVRDRYPEAVLLHYLDDILIADQTPERAENLRLIVTASLEKRGLRIAEQKIQRGSSIKYLGSVILPTGIQAQLITLSAEITNLHEAQKLVGALQWLRQFAPVTTEEMHPFY